MALVLIYKAVDTLHRSRALIQLDRSSGRTTTSPTVSCLVALLVLSAVGVALTPENIAPRDGSNALAWFGIIATCLTGACLFAPFSFHRWRWNSEAIEWRGLWRAVKIPWRDIAVARAKRWSQGEFEIAGPRGEKIEWSIFTLGADFLFEALRLYRPDLESSIPMEDDDPS